MQEYFWIILLCHHEKWLQYFSRKTPHKISFSILSLFETAYHEFTKNAKQKNTCIFIYQVILLKKEPFASDKITRLYSDFEHFFVHVN